MSHIPAIRDGLRFLATQASSLFDSRGFVHYSSDIYRILVETEEPESVPCILAHIGAGQSFLQLRQHKEAESHFREAGQLLRVSSKYALPALHELAIMLAMVALASLKLR